MSFDLDRVRMVQEQLRARGIENERVLRAFATVPREHFLAPGVRRRMAYLPSPLPIGHGQTLSQPWIVARMLELAEVAPRDTVLDVGAGSGYQTALLACLCRKVHGVERVPELAARAEATLGLLEIENAQVHAGDGAHGLPEHAPYDAIVVAAAARAAPPALLQQLEDGGRLVIPVGRQLGKTGMALRMLLGRPAVQRLHRYRRHGDRFEHEVLEGVHFVPFVGA